MTRTLPPWVRTLPWKALRLVISLVAVLTLTFLMIQLIPGDPVRLALGPDAPVSLVEERRVMLGLDKPFWEQYLSYWGKTLSGDYGVSLLTQQPVSLIVQSRIGNTAAIVVIALVGTMFFAVLGGLLFGIATHRGRRPWLRFGFNLGSGAASAIPDFLLAVGLVYVFAVSLKLLPVAGAQSAASFVLPTLAIALGSASTMMRVVRSATDVVLDQDYMLTARAKRLPWRRLYLRHALPNLLTAALTLGGLQLGAVVTGSIVVENVFAIPGLGTALVQALITRDYPVVQTTMLIFAGAVLVLNLVVDILLGIVDPRSRTARA
jgi:peptide/nickel transport system permease protein